MPLPAAVLTESSDMARLLVSAAHKSSGKTTVSVGVAAALRTRGLVVQPFKKGPDYIDPMWLTAAARRSCRNLDFHTMGQTEIRSEFARRCEGADLALVEGNKGLHDGVSVDGADSNAALAKLLVAPVVLVLDTRGITRGIAPLLCGYRDFDPGVRIAGIIFNQVGGARHESKLVHAVRTYTDIPVLGAIGRAPDLSLGAAHLGLVPPAEIEEADARVERVARRIEADVDLDRVLAIAVRVEPIDIAPGPTAPSPSDPSAPAAVPTALSPSASPPSAALPTAPSPSASPPSAALPTAPSPSASPSSAALPTAPSPSASSSSACAALVSSPPSL